MSETATKPDRAALFDHAVGACASLGAAVHHVHQARLHLVALGASTEAVDGCERALRDAIEGSRKLVRDGVA